MYFGADIEREREREEYILPLQTAVDLTPKALKNYEGVYQSFLML